MLRKVALAVFDSLVLISFTCLLVVVIAYVTGDTAISVYVGLVSMWVILGYLYYQIVGLRLLCEEAKQTHSQLYKLIQSGRTDEAKQFEPEVIEVDTRFEQACDRLEKKLDCLCFSKWL